MSEVLSNTRFVTKEAPTVEAVEEALKALRTYRWTREVLPTPAPEGWLVVDWKNVWMGYLGRRALRSWLLERSSWRGWC